MSYTEPKYISFSHTFDYGGGAADTFNIKGPAGHRGRLVDITVSALEVFTTGGKVEVGTASDADAYGSLTLGTLAEAAVLSAAAGDGTIIDTSIAADSTVKITLTQTGGTPTGIGITSVTIAWFKA
jgi:hypothetical protein